VLRGRQPLRLEMLTNVAQLGLLCGWLGLGRGLGCWVVTFLVFGAIDAYAGYPLHHTESAWTVGDPAHSRKRDMAEHIVAATVDYDVGAMPGWQSMLCYELMPNHCLHHCFPTVDCSKFEVIRPVFEETLKEYGVRQKLLAQPMITWRMLPAWLRGTRWYGTVKSLLG
jgi:fatty acid desaturase